MKNIDKIKNMSAKELADVLLRVNCFRCVSHDESECSLCRILMQAWLELEVENE